MPDIVTIGLALDTSAVLQGTRQVDAALKSVATASTTTAQATQKLDAAAKTAGQAMTGESAAAQSVTNALRQEAQASGIAASQTSEVSQAAQAAAAALQKEQQAALGAAEALHKTGQAAGSASTLVQRLGSSMGAIGQQAASFAVAQVGVQSLEQALSGVVNFASSSVRAALQTESLSAAFKAIEGSGQAAGRTMQFLKDTANRLGVDVVALSTGFKTIDAASRGTSLQGEQIRKVFVAMAEASRVLGLSGQDLNGVLLAVGQSISKGTVQAEELRGQIGERLPGAFQIAARAMGVTTTELDKMMERGELQATTFWPRFAETIKKEFGGSVEEASKTAGAAFERFHNTMREFQVNVGQLVIPPLNWIIDKMNAVVGAANKAKDAIAAVGKAQSDAAAEAQRLAGGKDVGTDLQKQFVAAQAAEQQAREVRQRLQGSTWAGDKVRLAAAQQEENAAIEKRIALGKQLESANKAAQRTGDPLGEGAAVEPGARDERLVEFQKKLTDQARANREELEKLDRVTQQLYGRKPTEDEILKVKEQQVTATKKLIDTSQELWNRSKDTAPAKELRAQAAGTEALEKSIKAAGEAGRAGKKDAAEAAREEEQARKEALESTMAKGKAIYVQDQDVVDLLAEMQRRTTSLTLTEEERFAQRVKAMAEEHPAMAQLLEDELARYKAAQDTNDALKERNKLLVDQAAASKSHLDDLTRLHKQLEPSRRGQTTAERLAGTRADIAARVAGKPEAGEVLAKADKQIKETLDTELWHKWEDAGLDALDHVGKALEEFVFKGKLNFKDLLGSIAQDIFRTSLNIVKEQATKKGGWLEMGLNLLSKVPALLGGGGGVPSSTAPTAPAGGLGSEAAWFQHGGPVTAGRPYMVGEAGVELFVPRTSGTIVPNDKLGGGTTVVNVHVSGVQDAQSFVQSRGAVSRAMMGALSQARQQM